MDAVQKANAGHPGTAMALAPVAYLLYAELMRHNPADPAWPDRDRFVLSAGHACILQYAALHLTGYDLSARRPQAVPPVGLADARASRSTASRRASRRPPARSARAFANGVGMALAERFLARALQPAAPRDRRPPRLRDLLRRRPDGGRRLARRPRSPASSGSASSSTSTTTTGSRSTARRRSRSRPRTRARASRPTAGTSSTSHDVNDLDALRAAIEAARGRDRAAALIVVRSAHRLSGSARDRHGQGARQPARRGRGARDQGGARLGPGRALLRPRRRSTST